jgi:transcriptional regulator with XRE-family HTH domain
MGKFDGKISEYSLGERLRYLRVDRGLTQTEMAVKIGMSQGAVAQIEKGQVNLNIVILRKIADVLNVAPAVLFAEDDVIVLDLKRIKKYKSKKQLPPSLKKALNLYF